MEQLPGAWAFFLPFIVTTTFVVGQIEASTSVVLEVLKLMQKE